jgi:hypothetical protein
VDFGKFWFWWFWLVLVPGFGSFSARQSFWYADEASGVKVVPIFVETGN